MCLSVSMFVSTSLCDSHVKPPEEIEGDDELEELIKPPRPASPVDYTESNLCKCIM